MTYIIPYAVRPVDPNTVDVDAFGWDTETHLMAEEALAPRLVCITTGYEPDHKVGEAPLSDIVARADEGGKAIGDYANLICDPDSPTIRVAHNASFDLAVLAAQWPGALPSIFLCLEKGLFQCTKIREKLLLLATTGDLNFRSHTKKPTPVDLSLAGLVKHYFSVDITESKKGEDAWRLNYALLDEVPSAQWPVEAINYAKEDAVWALVIKRAQEKERQRIIAERGIDPFIVQNERLLFDFCLHLISCQGVCVDHEEKARIQEWLAVELEPTQFKPLYEAGILVPAIPPKPKKGGGETQGKKESKSDKTLREYVLGLATKLNVDPEEPVVKLKYTDPSTKFPEGQLSIGAEFLEEHAHLDPLLGLLQHRQSLQKLVTTELPRMCVRDRETDVVIRDANVVHPMFDSIKSTGRSSSKASDIVPSFNCQNVHPKVRPCFKPRDGYLFCSVDFSYMELCTFAQACYSLFGHSRLAEIINAGHDPHAWLGSMLAYRCDPNFSAYCGTNNLDPFEAFMAFKKGGDDGKAYFKHWRTFAKPTGLGFPGGLSSKTMVAYAKATYGVEMTEETAKMLREAWLDALPEARLYLKEWVPNQTDPWNTNVRKFKDKETGEEIEKIEPALGYFSPFGMHRAGADYCAVANGYGLQTWSGDGFMSALIAVVRSAFDTSLNSKILFPKVRPVMPIHDEIISEVLDDGHAHEYASEIGRLMVEAFSIVLPNVKIKAQPVLMRRWYKQAEPVFDESGKLIPWEPPA